MCGICAIYGVRPDVPDEAIKRMTGALAHRGPDAQTWERLDGADLGHARLSIIDLEGGTQPMADGSGRFWILSNGELYNYRELRAELAGAGHRFRTQSDTEVFLAAYRQWGPGCLDRFRGMFAFAIWDTADRALFAARDLLGEKPLYYAVTADGSLLLASEIRSLAASGLVSPRIDRTAVDAYLCFGYVPPDRTVYANVATLPPAHYLEWRPGQEARVSRYWRPVFATRPIAVEDAAERLRALLEQAVRRQMVADVPVGAFLSGGHDSSTIVALMQQQSTQPVKTFSVGFGDVIDELPYARLVADRYGTDHHAIDLGAPPVTELLERMADVYDEPFRDPSHVPTYLVSEYARRYVKVALSGDGADELFGGYAWYPGMARSLTLPRSLPVWLALRGASAILPWQRLAGYTQAVGRARRWPDPWARYIHSRMDFTEERRHALWGRPEGYRPFFPGPYFQPGADATGMDAVLHFDLASFLPGDILVKVDRASMAHGLETRAPFLDRDVVEFALTLPAGLKVRDGETKVLFKHALRRFWPDAVATRKKQGFAAPYRVWLGLPEVQAIVRRVFHPGSALRALLPGLPAGVPEERSYPVWNLMTLGLWLERHQDSLG